MESYLVDTTVLIDLSRGVPGIRRHLETLTDAGAELGICAVNVAEFFSGIPSDERSRWDTLLGEFKYWEIPTDVATLAGAFRHALARQGRALHVPDALIAAVAAAHRATILTDNVKDFPMADVQARPLRP